MVYWLRWFLWLKWLLPDTVLLIRSGTQPHEKIESNYTDHMKPEKKVGFFISSLFGM